MIVEYEPLDTRLAERISGLHARIEALNTELAETRRTAGKKAAEDFKAEYLRQSDAMEKMCAEQEAGALAAGPQVGGLEPQPGFEGRDEEVKKTWENSLKALNAMGPDLEKTRERAERAEQVVRYLAK